MMYQEFIEIAGYDVSFEDYTNYIEPMYMALPTVDKRDFVKMVDRKRFEIVHRTARQIVGDMKKQCKAWLEIWGLKSGWEYEGELEKLAREYMKEVYNIDGTSDDRSGLWCYFHKEYEYPGQRGCHIITDFVIMGKYSEAKRYTLIKV